MTSFDEQPDGDVHGECAVEISRLQGDIATLEQESSQIRARMERLESENAVLTTDAERYRLLRWLAVTNDEETHGKIVDCMIALYDEPDEVTAEMFDKAVDVGREARKHF